MTTSPIQSDLACTACGYNLRTLYPTGRCPECGQEITITLEQLRSNPLLAAGSFHLRQIAVGFALCCAAWAVSLFAVEWPTFSGLLSALGGPGNPRTAFILSLFDPLRPWKIFTGKAVFAIVAFVLHAAGVLCITASPRDAYRPVAPVLRWLARITATVPGALLLVLAFNLDWSNSRPDFLQFWGILDLPAAWILYRYAFELVGRARLHDTEATLGLAQMTAAVAALTFLPNAIFDPNPHGPVCLLAVIGGLAMPVCGVVSLSGFGQAACAFWRVSKMAGSAR